jgi:hypothetical protein
MKSTATEWIIQPETIRRKAERRYKEILVAWFQGKLTDAFPMEIHGKKNVSSNANYAELTKQMRRLREESSEHRSHSYRVEWEWRDSHKWGKNEFPKQIFIDTIEDYLALIGKKAEFRHIESTVAKIRDSFPELDPRLATQLSDIPKLAEDDIDPLLAALKYFRDHPKPDCFLREIPAEDVHTKFIERPEIERFLREWLDIILPAWAIRSDEKHFERRYFLRYDEPLIRMRFLDPVVQQAFGFPCSYVAIPLHSLGNLDARGINVIIVENKVTLLTLPPLLNTVAIGGLGNAVTLLKYVPWLHNVQITYWGDLDSEGFLILSNLRKELPNVRSMLMDVATLERFKLLLTIGNGRNFEVPIALDDNEKAAFLRCRDENIRLEQERIPMSILASLWQRLYASDTG